MKYFQFLWKFSGENRVKLNISVRKMFFSKNPFLTRFGVLSNLFGSSIISMKSGLFLCVSTEFFIFILLLLFFHT